MKLQHKNQVVAQMHSLNKNVENFLQTVQDVPDGECHSPAQLYATLTGQL